MAAEAQTVDLASWLTAVWDEEERLAKEAATHSGIYEPRWSVRDYPYEGISFWSDEEAGGFKDARTRHVELHDPASVLARIAADRKILELHNATDWCGPTERSCEICHEDYSWGPDHADWPCATLKALVSPYKDREGFQEAWL